MKPLTLERLQNQIKYKESMRDIFLDHKARFEKSINNLAEKVTKIGLSVDEDVYAKAVYQHFDSHIENLNKEIEAVKAKIKALEANN